MPADSPKTIWLLDKKCDDFSILIWRYLASVRYIYRGIKKSTHL